jgi:hypothetical protein
MVYVMTQHHGVDMGCLEREGTPVASRRVRATLDHAAVQQECPASCAQDVAGTGHFTRGAEKLQLHAAYNTAHLRKR